jgi:hypothetical protein
LKQERPWVENNNNREEEAGSKAEEAVEEAVDLPEDPDNEVEEPLQCKQVKRRSSLLPTSKGNHRLQLMQL